MSKRLLHITYSIADQNFEKTKSIGIFNLSMALAAGLAQRPEVERLSVLSNYTLTGRLRLPASAGIREYNQAIGGKLQRMLWDQSGVYQAAKKEGNEWLFLPKGFASFLRPCPVHLAAYVHDVMRDFYRQKYPNFSPKLERCYFEQSFKATIRHARIIFTNSDFTTSEIRRLIPSASAPLPIKTVGIGFHPPAASAMTKANRIVVLAGRFPHKRTDLAVDYLTRWQMQTKYSGGIDWIGSLPTGTKLPEFSNWQHHQRLPEAEYRKLTQQARILVFFSEYEGFGMPPVEAALAGTCPVFSAIPVTTEVMTGTGCAFENADFGSFAKAMTAALSASREVVEQWSKVLLAKHHPDLVVDRVIKGLLEAG